MITDCKIIADCRLLLGFKKISWKEQLKTDFSLFNIEATPYTRFWEGLECSFSLLNRK